MKALKMMASRFASQSRLVAANSSAYWHDGHGAARPNSTAHRHKVSAAAAAYAAA